ncbi:MAG TPA: L-dopachrome tautomerase-related protein [Candidatus Angelobacter sp.]|nr:L-dopachrome tautomerase-related protein [Candidatus Angelobacter sp.]
MNDVAISGLERRLLRFIFILCALCLAGSAMFCQGADTNLVAGSETNLVTVFQDDLSQFTGVALSRTGRMFVNYPRWQGPHDFDVVEITSNGIARPFPDKEWNSWKKGESGSNKWVSVQAVYVDDNDYLWVVDAGAPQMEVVEDHGAKLVKIDLKHDRVARIFNLTELPGKDSYLNDVRVDTESNIAYLTESKQGGIVVLDTQSGKARMVLRKEPPVVSDPNHKFVVGGGELQRGGKPMKVNSDGIALSPDREWLYFKPLSDTKLYRIRTADLRDALATGADVRNKVQDLGTNFTTSDGMIFDKKGNLYLSDVEHGAIMQVKATRGLGLRTVVRDPRLIWPDTFAWGPDGSLYVSCSQIQNMPWFHNGRSTRTTPYKIYKLKVDAE